MADHDVEPWHGKVQEETSVVTPAPRDNYQPLYAEKRCANCSHWRGQHIFTGEDGQIPEGLSNDALMRCPHSTSGRMCFRPASDDQEAIDADKLARIRKLHSPVPIPEGKRWIGADKSDDVPCAGCRTGDPYLDQTWPCETREIADEGITQ